MQFNYFGIPILPPNLFDDVSGTKFFLITEGRFSHEEGIAQVLTNDV